MRLKSHYKLLAVERQQSLKELLAIKEEAKRLKQQNERLSGRVNYLEQSKPGSIVINVTIDPEKFKNENEQIGKKLDPFRDN
jgi:hypothetical protein